VALGLALAGCASAAARVGVRPREGWAPGTDDVQLYYRVLGRGRDTVVVVHGFPGSGQGYLAPDLLPLARGRVVVFYDQRGAGRSSHVEDTAQLGVEAHVRDLEALRRHFRLQQLTLLGHSGGAAIAARYAIEHPGRVERLVLVSPPPPVAEPYADETTRRFRSRLESATWGRLAALQASLATARDPRRVCRAITATVLPRAYFADPARFTRMRGDFCSAPPDRLRTRAMRTAAFLASLPRDWRGELRGVSAPVLVLHGDHDAIPVDAARAWVASIPGARLVVIPGADHLPWVEQPARFFAAVDSFLRSR
jgi:proline iminopeptidase